MEPNTPCKIWFVQPNENLCQIYSMMPQYFTCVTTNKGVSKYRNPFENIKVYFQHRYFDIQQQLPQREHQIIMH